MVVGVPKETHPGERRVALVPALVPPLAQAGLSVVVEAGAGAAAGFPDAEYAARGAEIVPSRAEVFRRADTVLLVRGYGAAHETGAADLALMRPGQVVVGLFEPLSFPGMVQEVADTGASAFSMELIPRITRAQSMDALSSMATVAGYKAVLLAAVELPKMFPLMMTAAGTLTPARVFVLGAGVAGLQAISTAKRLGAVVAAFDVRPAVKEQVESLGARFVELPVATAEAEDRGGYARAQSEETLARQRELMARTVAESDVVITTAAVPGRKAPILVTEEMVRGMAPGSVIVDLAAERGGNCALTRPGRTVREQGVVILGPTNLASEAPYHASQMYAKNVTTFLLHLLKDGAIPAEADDEIHRETRLTRDGQVVHPRLREILGNAAADPADRRA